jgi:GNAT superfamily N-acetyltransferase
MDRDAVLAAYDEQIRRHPQPDAPEARIECEDGVVRRVEPGTGWSGVTWSDLDEARADAVIAAQIRRFADVPGGWEWKHYSYDRPPDLPERLLAAGFEREPTEALLVAEVTELALDTAPPPGVELRPVVDEPGAAALVAVLDEVFGGNHAHVGSALLGDIAREPSTAAAVVAFAGDAPIASGRVQFPDRGDFAGLWGAATVPAWRGRGAFRSIVAHRARLAAARGYRYLQLDASDDSRPIPERLGFVALATTTPFVLSPPPRPRTGG